jgi:hypothetical protein
VDVNKVSITILRNSYIVVTVVVIFMAVGRCLVLVTVTVRTGSLIYAEQNALAPIDLDGTRSARRQRLLAALQSKLRYDHLLVNQLDSGSYYSFRH